MGTPGFGAAVAGVALGAAGAAATGAGGATAAGGSAAFAGGAACGTVNVGRSIGVGTIIRGGAAGCVAVGGGAGAFGATTADFASDGGGFTATGRGGVAAAGGCCLLMIAFSTSPGFEILERSILVLMPSDSGRLTRAERGEEADSEDPRRWRRTLSASWSSSELE